MPSPAECLYMAMGAKLGIKVETDNPTLARAKLYKARKEDPDLEILQIRISPYDPNVIWIVKVKNHVPAPSRTEDNPNT